MKKNLTLLLAFVLLALAQVNAQQTGDEFFAVDLIIDGEKKTYKEGACGFSAPDDWGGPILSDFCLPIVWGYDISPDSLGCDTIVNNYAGKAVMIRRAVCEFGAKAYYVQQAGGALAVIVNGTASTHGTGCDAPGMGPGAKGALVTTTPAIMICRDMADVIDAALKAGQSPEICIRRLTLHDATAEYAYATPISQADTVELITVGAVNRTGLSQDLTAKVVVTEPSGAFTEITSTQFVEAGADSIFYFGSYIFDNLEVGTYNLTYSVDKATEVGDTIYRQFRITEHTFATDNLISNGGAFNNTSFTEGGNKYTAASLFKTGDTELTVSYASFGLNNAATIAVADPAANVVNVILYDADADNNGTNNIGTGVTAFSALPFVAFNDFTFDATIPVDAILNVELTPIDGDKVILKPNHFYYLALVYDGTAAATGMQLSYTVSSQIEYGQFTGIGLITPIVSNNLYSGWGGATVIARLQEEGYDPTTGVITNNVLDASKYVVSPNPAVDYVNVDLKLADVNESVVVSLFDYTGRIVAKQTVKNFQSGLVKFDTRSLPSGYYAVSVRASEEGSSMKNLMICH